jgi:ApbE superfamily uncharacterized protein (UPF0280 family)
MRAQIHFLADGQRLHLQDGPIDLILQAWGSPTSVNAAYEAASRRFLQVLDELCGELPLLRSKASEPSPLPAGPVARRMAHAVAPYAKRTFITPMAAVAGAVAEEILQHMTSSAPLSKAYVNDGGDIALHLTPGTQFNIGLIDRPDRPSLMGTAAIASVQPVRGIATSGWRGRSFSLGIADAVTVLARTAAMADSAATIVANAVDRPNHAAIHRVPACSLAPDSDLADLLVTQSVGQLSAAEIDSALSAGLAMAAELQREGLLHSAALHLQGVTRILVAGVFCDHPETRSLIYA